MSQLKLLGTYTMPLHANFLVKTLFSFDQKKILYDPFPSIPYLCSPNFKI